MAVLALAAAGAAAAEGPQATAVDGPPFRGQLSAADANWQLTFAVDGRPRVVPAVELVQWGTCPEPARGPIVALSDGSLLVAEVLRADKEHLAAEADLFSAVKLPLESLAGVVFHLPAARRDRDLLLDRLVQAAGESDRLILDNGDEVSGLLEGIADDVVQIRAEVGPLKIETQRIAALMFNPALRQKPKRPPLHAWAGFADGSRLAAARLLVDDKAVRLTTLTGQTFHTSPEKLVFLQPLGGRAVYLSDLKADGYRHVPFLDLSWPYRLDRTVTGERLRCGGRLYLKGIGMHSAARLTYQLEGPFRRFEAELGIDDSTTGGGSVRFRVFCDGREKFSSEIIRGGAAPVPISIDVSGVKRLDLLVDYADRGDVLDHADWLSPRLVR